jgi:hypothetical protein
MPHGFDHFPTGHFPVDRVPAKVLEKVPFSDALHFVPPAGAFVDTPASQTFTATDGADIFVFYTAFESHDTIIGFDPSEDRLIIVDDTPDSTSTGYAPPTHTMLYESPNPVVDSTIQFIDFVPGEVTLTIYDTFGRPAAGDGGAFGLF